MKVAFKIGNASSLLSMFNPFLSICRTQLLLNVTFSKVQSCMKDTQHLVPKEATTTRNYRTESSCHLRDQSSESIEKVRRCAYLVQIGSIRVALWSCWNEPILPPSWTLRGGRNTDYECKRTYCGENDVTEIEKGLGELGKLELFSKHLLDVIE